MNVELESKKVAIIDYGLGNLFSVRQALFATGVNAFITDDKQQIQSADAIVVPGVGAFAKAMENLEKKDLIDIIKNSVKSGKPFLGLCLGLQLLFESSDEFGRTQGLGLIEGEVLKFPRAYENQELKVPQIAWNRIHQRTQTQSQESILHGVPDQTYVYFIHSYYAKPKNPGDQLCMTTYNGFEYCSGIQKDNISALQFHPEKSAKVGAMIFNNWVNLI